MWRLIYSPSKLSPEQRQYVQLQLEHYLYTCGSDLANFEMKDDFPKIYARELHCGDLIERQLVILPFVYTVLLIFLLMMQTSLIHTLSVVIVYRKTLLL